MTNISICSSLELAINQAKDLLNAYPGVGIGIRESVTGWGFVVFSPLDKKTFECFTGLTIKYQIPV
ncbi:hypothetical protein [Microcystis sp. M061S2]|uniref:hypothetical protein n=1 Tax=Microcystis sp. M061S2 TaxID=2771171 RepID=UPI0025905590|nr:hypothetical protein [Microcystis sp. M061S2]MCA2652878.1 hypothetical protein [Microcystis sp. M061S2]